MGLVSWYAGWNVMQSSLYVAMMVIDVQVLDKQLDEFYAFITQKNQYSKYMRSYKKLVGRNNFK